MDTTKLVIPPGGGATWEMAQGRSVRRAQDHE
jgi:hypothetical protein